MVRLFTFLTFLLLGLIVVCIYFYNSIVSADWSINQWIKDLEIYFTERAIHAESLWAKNALRLFKKAKTNDEKIIADNSLSDFIEKLLEENSGDTNNETLTSLVTLEHSVASKKRFVDAKTSFYNERIQTFPSSLIAKISWKKEHTLFTLTWDESLGVDPDFKV